MRATARHAPLMFTQLLQRTTVFERSRTHINVTIQDEFTMARHCHVGARARVVGAFLKPETQSVRLTQAQCQCQWQWAPNMYNFFW